MLVMLDGQPLEAEFPVGLTLQGLLDRVRPHCGPQRLIVGVERNGAPLVADELCTALGEPLALVDQIDVTTGDQFQIVAAALRDVALQLDDTLLELPPLAGELQAGRVADAMKQVDGFIRVWQSTQRAVTESSALLGRDLTLRTYQDRPIQQHTADLLARLRELRDGFQARDFVLIADLMQFEMPALCETWRDLLRELADDVAAGYARV